MAETTQTPELVSPEVEPKKVRFYKRLPAKYPRISRVVAATAAALAVVGVVTAVKNKKESDDDLDFAGELTGSEDLSNLDPETTLVTEA